MGRLNRSLAATRYVLGEDGSFTSSRRTESLTPEEPLEIRLDGRVITTTMRTPGHDLELAHGFLHSEGIIRGAEDIRAARYCAGATGPDGANTYNVLDLTSAGAVLAPGLEHVRLTVTNSACGVCGSTSIESIMGKANRPIAPAALTPQQILDFPQQLREQQVLFGKTGGIHGAAVFDSQGSMLVAREDIGRHNAVDKVIGYLLLKRGLGEPESGQNMNVPGKTLVVSSRASFELVQKAVLAGFSALVAVSAPSSLAVDLARQAGLTLIAFTRDNRFTLYAGHIAEHSR